ncbi:MAG: DUF3786 domain-containing protein [Nitrososphaerota archaeon]|nr:DUF3786 domain-containing protein [Candidatus Calditenuaceae archaeon]MDW8073515.1 DUF3786 domain-containing protein [Nitrososphaerota archaeon]
MQGEELDALLAELRQRPPEQVVKLCHVVHLPPREGKGDRFLINVLNGSYVLDLATGAVSDAVTHKASQPKLAQLLIKYLARFQGGKPGEWIPLEKFPRGQVYAGEIMRRAYRPLIEQFGYDPVGFDASCKAIDGEKEKLGGLSFSFSLFPMIRLLLQLWAGDERTYRSPTANMMFSNSYLNVFTAEEAVDSAEFLVSELIKIKKKGGKTF